MTVEVMKFEPRKIIAAGLSDKEMLERYADGSWKEVCAGQRVDVTPKGLKMHVYQLSATIGGVERDTVGLFQALDLDSMAVKLQVRIDAFNPVEALTVTDKDTELACLIRYTPKKPMGAPELSEGLEVGFTHELFQNRRPDLVSIGRREEEWPPRRFR